MKTARALPPPPSPTHVFLMVDQLPTVRYSPRDRIHWIYEFICLRVTDAPPASMRPSPGEVTPRVRGRPERAATPLAHTLYIPLSLPRIFLHLVVYSATVAIVSPIRPLCGIYKSAPRWGESANEGVKQAVPYRTGREAWYLSVSTE
jgi:hypothetical protein